MLVSFNWYKYSVVIGLLKKRASTAMIPGSDGSEYPARIERKEESVEDACKRIDETTGESISEGISERIGEETAEEASERASGGANERANEIGRAHV